MLEKAQVLSHSFSSSNNDRRVDLPLLPLLLFLISLKRIIVFYYVLMRDH